MVLSNAAKRARLASTTMVQNQGGGDKKAGLPHQVGRTSWSNIHMGLNTYGFALGRKRCCTRSELMNTSVIARFSRPVGMRPIVGHGKYQ
jgi:hypothetical protein